MNRSTKQIREIYENALRRDASKREAYLDRVCGGNGALRSRVARLLRAREDVGEFLADPTRARPTELPPGVEEVVDTPPPAPVAPTDQAGRVIGRYKLLQRIGEGGFGVVYMAEQHEPVRRKVALKIIKRGMDTDQVVARFEAERQALALMDHPNIAKVLDGGATRNGRPYFVMELVRGVPITEYCDKARVDTRQRLELFRQVCQAVQHAHTKGIIHRDLKPSNVLVTLHDGQPVPKVIDFGIAKAIDRNLTEKTLFTQFQQMIGTPEYMAPEQAEMSGLDVDTRADIYSLGVMLYELLTGTKPLDLQRMLKRGFDEMVRTIREEEPPRPSTRVSTLARREIDPVAKVRQTSQRQLGLILRGDLDWIVMKALEKDRQRRYETASEFADDIRRHLDDQPVLAGPPSALYRLHKYMRRHRAGVATAGAVVLALLAGLSAATWGWLEARDQSDRAETALGGEREARRTEAEQRRRAEEGERVAKRERDEKEQARAELEEALRRSEGTRLSALSQAVVSQDAALALLLAIEGAEREPGAFANRALLEALEKSPRRDVVLDTDGTAVSAAWSPDESTLVTGTSGGTIEVWDATTGERQSVLRRPHGSVVWLRWIRSGILACFFSNEKRCSALVAWDPAGGEVRSIVQPEQRWTVPQLAPSAQAIGAVEVDTGRIHLLSLETGALIRTLPGEGPWQQWQWPQVSPDATRYVMIAEGKMCRLCDGVSGEMIAEWEHRGNLPARFSADGTRVLASEPERVVVRDAADGSEICTLADSRWASYCKFTPDGRYVVSTQGDVRTWDAATGRLVCKQETKATREGVLTPDGGAVLYQQWGGGAEIRSLRTGDLHAEIPCGVGFLRAVASDWRLVLMSEERARIFDPVPAGRPLRLAGRSKPCSILVHPDGRTLFDLTGIAPTPPRLWDLETGRATRTLPGHMVFMEGIRMVEAFDADFSPDGNLIATAGDFGRAHVFDARCESHLCEIQVSTPERPQTVISVRFSPDGRYLVLGGTMSRALVYEPRTGKLVARLGDAEEHKDGEMMSISLGGGPRAEFDPSGQRVLLHFGPNSSPSVWEVESERKLLELDVGEGQRLLATGFSPGGKWAYASTTPEPGLSDGVSHIFDASTGERVCTIPGFNGRGPRFPAGFSRDGQTLLVCRPGEGVHLHEVPSGKRLRTFVAPGEAPNRACFSPDNRWVLGVSHGRFEVYVWDAASGRLQHHLTDGNANSFWHNAAFTNDSRSVITSTMNGIRVLPIELLPTAIRLRPRELTASERLAYRVPERGGASDPVRIAPSNGVEQIVRSERQFQSLDSELQELLGPLYTLDEFSGFRSWSSWVGLSDEHSYAIARVADRMIEFGHYDAAVRVYEMALREAAGSYGSRSLAAADIRLDLCFLLDQLGRGAEIEPHLGFLGSGVSVPYRSRIDLCRGRYLLSAGEPAKALEILAPLEPALGNTVKVLIAQAHIDLGQFREADHALKGTWDELLSSVYTRGMKYLKMRRDVRRFLELYAKWPKPEKLEAWQRIAAGIDRYRPRGLDAGED